MTIKNANDARRRWTSYRSWCIRVVTNRYGGFGGAQMEGVVGKYVGQNQEWLVACRAIPEHMPCA